MKSIISHSRRKFKEIFGLVQHKANITHKKLNKYITKVKFNNLNFFIRFGYHFKCYYKIIRSSLFLWKHLRIVSLCYKSYLVLHQTLSFLFREFMNKAISCSKPNRYSNVLKTVKLTVQLNVFITLSSIFLQHQFRPRAAVIKPQTYPFPEVTWFETTVGW